MVCDFPVPGGPSSTRSCPRDTAAMARSWLLSASTTCALLSGGKCASRSICAYVVRERGKVVAGARDQAADQAVAGKGAAVGLQVLVHHELLEGEQAQVDLRGHPPAGLRLYRVGHGGQERLQVVVVGDLRGVGEQRQRDAKVAAQVLGERGVQDVVVVRDGKRVPRAGRRTRQRDGEEDERRAEHLLGILRFRVVQHPQRQEERVYALLLLRLARLLLDAPQRHVQLVGGRGGLQHVVAVLRRERIRRVRRELRGRRQRLVILRQVVEPACRRIVGPRASLSRGGRWCSYGIGGCGRGGVGQCILARQADRWIRIQRRR